MLIYKIVPELEWIAAERSGVYEGSAKDKEDGFLHFSSATQLRGTLEKHYANVRGILVIAAVESEALGDALKWEASRGGEEFPHLYRTLLLTQVSSTLAIHYFSLTERDFTQLGEWQSGEWLRPER